MRLIDADAILQDIEECANSVEIQIHLGKCNEDVAKGMLSGLALVREDILRKDTAYDVEKVVAELEKLKQHNKDLSEGAYLEDDKSFYFCAYTNFARAIGIVKEGGSK